jgi:Putative endonuclease segE, GIY-YIG domain
MTTAKTKRFSSGRLVTAKQSEFHQIPKLGHWLFTCWKDYREELREDGGLDTSKWFGFIYRVTFLLTGEMYIGKKSFHVSSKWGNAKAQSNWRVYRSSSENIHELLQHYPEECFLFEILHLCPTRGYMGHAESNIIHKIDAITAKDTLGLPKYFNGRAEAIKWIARDFDGDRVNDVIETYFSLGTAHASLAWWIKNKHEQATD